MMMPNEAEFVDHHPESASDLIIVATYIYVSSIVDKFHHAFKIPSHAERVNRVFDPYC